MKASIASTGCRVLRGAVCPALWAIVAALLVVEVGVAATKQAEPQASGGGGSNAVLATIGNHSVTQAEVDSKVAVQLYDLRKKALDEVIDDYLLQQAAKNAGVKPDEYISQQLKSISPHITTKEAEQFYGQHKLQLDAQTGGNSFHQIKPRLIAAMQRQRDDEAQQELIRKLRAENRVSVLLQAPHVNVASAGHPSTGPSSAPVTIIEFSDFQCPFCRGAEPSLKQVQQKYGDRVRLVYMDFPLGFHAHAMDAAHAARCAADQNKFWQFHDALFRDQKKLDPDSLKQTAAKLGLDREKFSSCFTSDKHVAGIRQDVAEGSGLGVTGTPTFFINGQQLVGAQPLPKFSEAIDEELARAKVSANSRQAMK